MVESLQMFLFLFKSKYRRKWSWFSPFLCSVLIVLLLCQEALCKCSEVNCLNGVCSNDTCVCFEGWQGPECQFCGGKIKLTSPTGIITDGPGNYSVSVQCTWLIAPEWTGPSAPSIRIRLENFATECGWDYLYVYDGNSVRADTLLAVFSGVFQEGESAWTRQVVAKSGQALLHFFSDDAYAMEGFNLTYAAYSCPSNEHHTNCSNHGVCDDGECRCSQGWVGVACDEPLCPADCNAAYSAGVCTANGCECTPPRTGPDCARDSATAGWRWAWRERGETPPPPRPAPPPVAGHVLLNVGGDLVTVGGESFGDREFLYKYKFSETRWQPLEARGPAPAPRYLHSAVFHQHEALVYGGVLLDGDRERGGGLVGLEGRAGEVTNELWRIKLDTSRPVWVNATPTACSGHRQAPLGHCGGLHVSGHTAVLVYMGAPRKPVMLTFFGHSPHYGYLHLVQEYYLEEGHWAVATTRGWAARGGFGHAAAYDELSGRVYVVGGLLSQSEASQAPSAALHEYDVENRVWRPLPSAATPRYLHTATFISPGIMLVFGGNAHNDSAAAAVAAAGSKCYSGSAALYDVRCAQWLPTPPPPEASRVAHAAVPHPATTRRSVLIHGGFDGRLRSDALIFEAGAPCAMHASEYSCLRTAASAARACAWRHGACVQLEEIGWKESFESGIKACLNEPVLDERRCLSGSDCAMCTAAGCAWCGACYGSAAYCPRHRHQMALSIEECSGGEAARDACGKFHSCAACHAHRATHAHEDRKEPSALDQIFLRNEAASPRLCYWDYESVKCRPANATDDLRSANAGGAAAGCAAPCSTYKTCGNCTAEECIWCASAGRCVDKNAYGASFPLGGCRAWSTGAALCGAGCSQHASCRACRAEPACGWCDDGARAGRGACLPGAADRPHRAACPAHRWHFTACPACQCNGHATCDARAACIQPCAGRAVGAHCELCAPGHWGSPLNGGECTPCDCNGFASSCAADSGRCHCSTKGLAGERCDRCDAANHYLPDPRHRGLCYYDLAVDYQFTFNLSKKEDRHLSAINFRNSPVKPDVDADFSITCSSHARMNLTVRTRGETQERIVFTDVNCTNFRYKFAKSEHNFGMEQNESATTFFVYVYEFKPPLWIQISFSQYPKLNLQQFFITFSSCFLLLLLAAAAMWKIKQKYDMYRRRQRLFVEMEQMASRPFSQVSVELERGGGGSGVPAPVALEPCRGARAAVLSLLVRLPTGGTGVAPPLGGLAVASALVTLGLQPPHRPKPRPHH